MATWAAAGTVPQTAATAAQSAGTFTRSPLRANVLGCAGCCHSWGCLLFACLLMRLGRCACRRACCPPLLTYVTNGLRPEASLLAMLHAQIRSTATPPLALSGQCTASSKPEGPAAIICMACESANPSRCTNCNGDLSGELEYGFYPDADGVCVKWCAPGYNTQRPEPAGMS